MEEMEHFYYLGQQTIEDCGKLSKLFFGATFSEILSAALKPRTTILNSGTRNKDLWTVGQFVKLCGSELDFTTFLRFVDINIFSLLDRHRQVLNCVGWLQLLQAHWDTHQNPVSLYLYIYNDSKLMFGRSTAERIVTRWMERRRIPNDLTPLEQFLIGNNTSSEGLY